MAPEGRFHQGAGRGAGRISDYKLTRGYDAYGAGRRFHHCNLPALETYLTFRFEKGENIPC